MKLADWRRDHVWLLFRQQRDMNGVRRQLAREITQAVTTQCADRDVYDYGCHIRVTRYIDRYIWPTYYGRFRGDYDAAFPRAIEAAGVRAFTLAWKRAWQQVVGILTTRDPELLAALRELAKERDNG